MLLDEAQVRNFARWDILGQQIDYNPPGWRDRDTYKKEVDWLKTWLEDRLAWMGQALAEERASAPPVFYIDGIPHNDDGYVQSGSTLSISSNGGNVYYTLDGSDPRLPGRTQPSESLTHILVPEEAEKKILIPSGPVSHAWSGSEFFNDRGWMLGAGGIGYDTGSGYRHLIDTDLYDLMYRGQTSCYTRIYFNNVMQDVSQFNIMILRIRYDDGFGAYLNGIEVARSNVPTSPQWNSTATSENPDGAAISFEDFDISSHMNVLNQGQNILAIHGLSANPSSGGFLISSEFVTEIRDPNEDYGISPTAHEYIDPMILTESVTVKARALSGNAWSALNKATYAVGPAADDLYVTKVMCQPQHDSDEEFGELTYTDILNPGEKTRIEDAIGRPIHDFTYKDD